MVYEVWQDGEITLTKGGDLWRKRSLHMLVAGVNPAYALPADQMPIKIGVNGSIIVESYDKALEAHRIVVSEARERHGKMAGPLL